MEVGISDGHYLVDWILNISINIGGQVHPWYTVRPTPTLIDFGYDGAIDGTDGIFWFSSEAAVLVVVVGVLLYLFGFWLVSLHVRCMINVLFSYPLLSGQFSNSATRMDFGWSEFLAYYFIYFKVPMVEHGSDVLPIVSSVSCGQTESSCLLHYWWRRKSVWGGLFDIGVVVVACDVIIDFGVLAWKVWCYTCNT